MNSHQVVYQADPSSPIRTLGHAIRILNAVPQPILRYRQRISLLAPDLDLCYQEVIRHDRDQHVLTIGFPSELVGVVGRIKNSHGCRMVTYWRNPVTDFVQEVQIGLDTQISCLHQDPQRRQEIRIYTRGVENLVVSFDVWLLKSAFFRSAL